MIATTNALPHDNPKRSRLRGVESASLSGEFNRPGVRLVAAGATNGSRDGRRFRGWKMRQGRAQRAFHKRSSLERGSGIRFFATFRRRGTSDHERDLAELEFRLVSGSTRELGQRTAVDTFVKLRELASDGGLSRASEGCGAVAQYLLDSMRRLEKHERTRLECEGLQSRPSLSRFSGQKTFETKTIRGNARHGKRCRNGRRPWDRPHLDARRRGTPNEVEPRVGQQRCTGITDEGNHLTFQQASEQGFTALTLVMNVQRNQGFLQTERREQLTTSSGVLGRDDIRGGQRLSRPRRHIGQIADRRCHHIETPARRSPASHYNPAPNCTARGHRARLRSGIQSAPTERLTGQTPPTYRLEHLE